MEQTFDFGEALKGLKAGEKVARLGWNGKGMYLHLVGTEEWCLDSPTNSYVGNPARLPWIGIRTTGNGFVPWLASQTDVLAEDWVKAP